MSAPERPNSPAPTDHGNVPHSWKGQAAALADRFLVKEWLGDAEACRRARSIVRFGFIGPVFGIGYSAFYLFIGHWWGALIIMLCSVCFIATPFLMRRTRSLELGGNLLPGVLCAGFTALCFVEGGLQGHAIAWLVGVPLWALLLARRSAAKWWFLASLLAAGAVIVAAATGWDLPRLYDPRWETLVSAMGYIGLIIFMFIVGMLFESLREQARAQTEEALARLKISNDQLIALNNEKNEFLGIAAHDLKNPLSTIIMGAGMLASKDCASQSAQITEAIGDAGRRMHHLITNLLDVNAIEEGRFLTKLERCDLAKLTKSGVEQNLPNAERKEIALVFEPGGEFAVRADPNATTQILDNLISNAVKYSPKRTTVSIRAYIERGHACVAVQDEGPGISEADRAKMFGKFARLSARPTGGESSNGLGLSIVKRLAEAMSGTVECQSKLGEGSTFIVRLPVWDDPPPMT
jgi:signal transduction histidine kinase